MATRVNLDFETRSEEPIKFGAWRYAKHPSTRVLCMAYSFDDDDDVFLWEPWRKNAPPFPQELADFVADGGEVCAWNSTFEYLIWNIVLPRMVGPLGNLPLMTVEQQRDTMAMASMHALPAGLAACGAALDLSDAHLKSPRGKYLIRKLCIPRKPSKNNPDIWVNDEGLLAELGEYCKQDVISEREIGDQLLDLPGSERRIWQMTLRMNDKGLPVDVEGASRAAEIVEQEKHRLNFELALLSDGDVNSATQRDVFLAWMHKLGIGLPDLRAESVANVLDRWDAQGRELPIVAKRALEIRAGVSKTSVAKLAKFAEVADDGCMKGMFMYHGAATGRWASRGGVNLQNLARPTMDPAVAARALATGDYDAALMLFGDNVIEAASSSVRGMVRAPKGYRFIDADFSSIENRVAPFLAGDENHLSLFRNGLDEYKDFAVDMYGVRYEKVSSMMRQVSKSAVLGCVFGQGPGGLVAYAASMGVKLTKEVAAQMVGIYRTKRAKIVSLWGMCARAAMDATNNPGTTQYAGPHLRFFRARGGDFLEMHLPSGRVIRFYKPEVQQCSVPWSDEDTRAGLTCMGINTYTRQWGRNTIIGSSIFQSAVQGTARDLLAAAMYRLEEAEYDIRGCFHDELLTLMPDGVGSLEEMIEIMTKVPSWAKGLPIAAEGWVGDRYRK